MVAVPAETQTSKKGAPAVLPVHFTAHQGYRTCRCRQEVFHKAPQLVAGLFMVRIGFGRLKVIRLWR